MCHLQVQRVFRRPVMSVHSLCACITQIASPSLPQWSAHSLPLTLIIYLSNLRIHSAAPWSESKERGSDARTWQPLWRERMPSRCSQPSYLPMKYMCTEVCRRWIAFEGPLNTPVDVKSCVTRSASNWEETVLSTQDKCQIHQGRCTRIRMARKSMPC